MQNISFRRWRGEEMGSEEMEELAGIVQRVNEILNAKESE